MQKCIKPYQRDPRKGNKHLHTRFALYTSCYYTAFLRMSFRHFAKNGEITMRVEVEGSTLVVVAALEDIELLFLVELKLQ